MKISKKWLLDILNIKDFDNKIFINKMIMSGFNVEKYYNFSNIDKIYTGKIIEKIKHPNSDKLFICKIKVFEDKLPYQIITNVNEVIVNDIVPIALENSIINNKSIIKKLKINNVYSYGSLCGIDDLGISKHDEPNMKYKNQIIIFNKNTKIGDNVKKILDIDDIIFDIEVTNNRSDCYNAYGLATEISSIMDIKLKKHKSININIPKEHSNKIIKINKNLKKYINSYFFQILKINKIKKSPRWLRRRLSVVEIIPENNFLIDIIHYIQYYYGYDIHITKINKFDKIEIDFQNEDIIFVDKFKNIFSKYLIKENNKYNKNDLILLSNINMKTKFIESKTLNYIKNNFSLIKYGNYNSYNYNYDKFRFMLNSYIKNNINILNNVFYEKYNLYKQINFNFKKINKILGINIDFNIMINILKKLFIKYNVKNNKLYVPIYRNDINDCNDIAEEIARIYGYDKINENRDLSLIQQNNFYENYKFKNKLFQLCTYLGFNEIITLPFLNNKYKNLLNIKIENSKIIYISNPLNEDNNCMRYTIIPSMFNIFNSIITKNKNSIINIYELGKIYKFENNNYCEEEVFCIISNNFDNILYFKEKILVILKDFIENINFKQSHEISWLHKYQQAIIFSNNHELGYIGKIHPKIASEMGVSSEIYIAKIYFDILFSLRKISKKYIKISKFPSITRDLSLICDKKIPSINIQETILSSNQLINHIDLFDIYSNEKFGIDKICLTFSITFNDNHKTLTDNIVDNIISDILIKLNKIYNIKLRDI